MAPSQPFCASQNFSPGAETMQSCMQSLQSCQETTGLHVEEAEQLPDPQKETEAQQEAQQAFASQVQVGCHTPMPLHLGIQQLTHDNTGL